MRYVECYKIDEEGDSHFAGRVEIRAGQLVFPPNVFSDRMVKHFAVRGIHDRNGKWVTTANPDAFLDALFWEFRSCQTFYCSPPKQE